MKRFPSTKYGRQTLTFFPAPFRPPLRAFAALVFPWREDKVLVCNIADRGWCIPSGRVEPDESAEEAARREALEEGGAILEQLQYIGCYQIVERQDTRWAECFTATVPELVDIVMATESLGRRFLTVDEVAEIYHVWNPMTQQVFLHAQEVLTRRLSMESPGTTTGGCSKPSA